MHEQPTAHVRHIQTHKHTSNTSTHHPNAHNNLSDLSLESKVSRGNGVSFLTPTRTHILVAQALDESNDKTYMSSLMRSEFDEGECECECEGVCVHTRSDARSG